MNDRTKAAEEDKLKPDGSSPAKQKKEPAERGSETLSEDDELTKRGHEGAAATGSDAPERANLFCG